MAGRKDSNGEGSLILLGGIGAECLRKLIIDSYRTEEPEKWYKEVRYFFDTQLSFLPHYKYSKFRTNYYGIISNNRAGRKGKLLNNEKKSNSSFLSIRASPFI